MAFRGTLLFHSAAENSPTPVVSTTQYATRTHGRTLRTATARNCARDSAKLWPITGPITCCKATSRANATQERNETPAMPPTATSRAHVRKTAHSYGSDRPRNTAMSSSTSRASFVRGSNLSP